MWETSQAPCPPENAAALSSPICPFQDNDAASDALSLTNARDSAILFPCTIEEEFVADEGRNCTYLAYPLGDATR
jgi:hypothetical protein